MGVLFLACYPNPLFNFGFYFFLLFSFFLLGFAFAQETRREHSEIKYRVLRFEELFSDDVELKAKVENVTFSSTYSDGSEFRYGNVRRIDMDAKDYETALNRLANQGWKLECVTKANYWVFSKQ